jgi:acyl dehydratase
VGTTPRDRNASIAGSALRVERAIDLAAFVGREFPPGTWQGVTQDQIDRFASLTGDRNWIHTDVARAARELEGGRTIVPGQLLLSLIPALLQEIYVVAGAGNSRVAGLRAVRFRQPICCGDEFRLHAQLILVRQRPRFVQVDTDCRLELRPGSPAVTAQRTDVFFPA